MCIGAPLQVVACDGTRAWCEADGQRELIDMLLVGEQPPGTWVLAFHGAARQVLDADEAAAVRAGRRAMAAVFDGAADVDDFFADLVGRVPTLPAHLLEDQR
ncbi:HypC/HybG/HupF family hydrogenase formation chaperone [Azohydromonas sediminis]|uniref:HypC/HybG/HupF family hydrogenase formation chaperone n=1 Tax=Azohydromonas sediminis TaxID=2259674 RepID=UPI000E64F39A|nr:HypC/HybG/HupF family hydrogenase formation chaperone [Azohydromonas sediminis]